MAKIPESRVEEILRATIDGTEYNKVPLSRVEEDLLELKAAIDSGGGGGTTDYNDLTNKPSINGHTLSGDMTSDDIGVQSKIDNQYDPSDEEVIINGGAGSNNTYDPEEENVVIGG